MENKNLDLRQGQGFCTLPVKVIPRSSQNKIVGVENGVLKLKLMAPPIEGAANEAVVEFLSKWLGKSKSAVALVKGQQSRNKLVKLRGVNAADVLVEIEKLKN